MSRVADVRKYRDGDVCGKIWPSDQWRNFSADGRVIGCHAAAAFRRALRQASQPNTVEGQP